MIEELQDAILSKDADGVVAALSQWDEEQRHAAIEPFNILMMALGFDDDVVLPCDLTLKDLEVVKKRKRDGIKQMSRRDRTIDYEMHYIAWLARYGLQSLDGSKRFSAVPDHVERSAQIMADRNPPWWDEWYTVAITEEGGISAEFWALLYVRDMVSANDFPPADFGFSGQLPHAMAASPEALKKVLHDIPECREQIYGVPEETYHLYDASSWVPVLKWMSEQNLIDHHRFLKIVIETLHTPLNQTERNGCLTFAKAIGASGETLSEFQSHWTGLISDGQASVAGFAVEQLRKIEKFGLLDAHEAVVALPGIFGHKPKKYAKIAIEMLGRIAVDEELRTDAVNGAASGLMHPNKDIQQAALNVLEVHLQPDDAATIEAIELHLESIASTLKGKATALLKFEKNLPAKESAKCSATSTEFNESATPLTFNTSKHEKAASAIPENVREVLRIGESLEAARLGSIDLSCRWSIKEMPVLASASALVPIESVEELIDVTSAAVEKLDCADTADRILSGIVRLHLERPESFESMTKSLSKRACADYLERPSRGITGGCHGSSFSLLIGAWLDVKADEDGYFFIQTPIQRFLVEVEQLVRSKTAYSLLSAATHSGGWIDPHIWIERLISAQKKEVDILASDLERSCLRLAPDGRSEALKQAANLQSPMKALALAALGGDVKINQTLPNSVWFAALRARDAWIDLSQHIEPDEQCQITDEMAKMPDLIFPSDYQWQVKIRQVNSSSFDLVSATPTQDSVELETNQNNLLREYLSSVSDAATLLEQMDKLANAAAVPESKMGFLTSQLHHLPVFSAPSFWYPYFASQWPMKLDWFWCLATKALSRRVESNSSVEDPFDQFLVPLLEQDRPLTVMSARALWIATVSKDSHARSMAIECWIALVESDRIDFEVLVKTLGEVSAEGWVKVNRVGEVLAEVASVSALHAWVVASVIDSYLAVTDPFPRAVATLLESLDECCELLGRAVTPELANRLKGIKSGKAKTLAKSLLDRSDTLTPARETAITDALNARLTRAERIANSDTIISMNAW